MKTVNNDRLNYINIILMAVAFGIARIAPLELLVFAYAVLGPLHYLTEIPWLKKRQYFANDKGESWLLWILSAIAAVPLFVKDGPLTMAGCTLLALAFALVMVLTPNIKHRVVLAAVIVPIAFVINPGDVLFGLYITTVIHVSLFTWLFMLAGCLKDKRLSGFLALAAMTLFGVSCFIFRQPAGDYRSTAVMVDSVMTSFPTLQKDLCELVHWNFDWNAYVDMTRFLAFAYTYHYFNWFSKTRIIRWHEVTPPVMALIVVLYIGSVTLYAINYSLGNKLLFFMSAAHVFLEFPLNWRTTGLIFSDLGRLLQGKSSASPAAET